MADSPTETPTDSAAGAGPSTRRSSRQVPNPNAGQPSSIPRASRGASRVRGVRSRRRDRSPDPAEDPSGSGDPSSSQAPGLSQTPGHSQTMATFGTLTETPTGALSTPVAKSTSKSKKEMTLEELYPDAALELTRAHVKHVIDKGSLTYISFTFKEFGKPSDEEYVAMKDVAEFEFRKHFIGMGTNKCVFYCIKKALPNVDLSSTVSRELRKHLLSRYADWKFDLVSDRIYAYVLDQLAQFGSQLDHDPNTKAGEDALAEFFGPRIDANLFKGLYGEANYKVLDVDLVFAEENRKKLAFWYLKQVLVNLFLRTVPLVKEELRLNKASGKDGAPTPWAARLPRNSTFVVADTLRKHVQDFFDRIPTNTMFSTVEMKYFPWKRYTDEAKKRIAVSAEGAARKLLASELADQEMRIRTPPPPAGTPFGSPFGSGASQQPGSGQGRRQIISPIPLALGRSRSDSHPSPLDSCELDDANESYTDFNMDAESDTDMTERSISPSIRIMERASKYAAAYH
ncbi:uncharacterized protein F4817DRAFT_350419 [Daldinia loculata]|uniref:uncharacterized protein n=1 Tax=Daldinia loculata TaxID=103429 RepID=UPI0020C26F36|nr:uncharacterized protein F4817DRAFT_350419 [Daldinia loculata]KAI1643224.1 hypothetical protein F4817DRAFT_350419 [Daldinia loculata]